jgi:hypothetical protein
MDIFGPSGSKTPEEDDSKLKRLLVDALLDNAALFYYQIDVKFSVAKRILQLFLRKVFLIKR